MASSLSFHCVICFDEFDTHTTYPVVLPCGHTYVCILCANRIDKCMECRTSLFTETATCIPTSEEGQSEQHSAALTHTGRNYAAARSGRRIGYTRSTSAGSATGGPLATTTKKKKERIALPKNLVLISLIESSQLIQQGANNKIIAKGLQQTSFDQENSGQDDDDDEETRIALSSDIANAACGTYAVATKEGLKIMPNDARYEMISRNEETHQNNWRNNVEDIVVNNAKKKLYSEAKELILNYGDRIQVVSIADNWAKLARGYGYVHFKRSSDLVKVGGVLDRAAGIEAMICDLSICRNRLIEAKISTEKDAIALLSRLQTTLLQEEDVTVIGAEAFQSEREESPPDELRETFSDSFSLNQGKSNDERDLFFGSYENEIAITENIVNTLALPRTQPAGKTRSDRESDPLSFLEYILSCDNISKYVTGSRNEETCDDQRQPNGTFGRNVNTAGSQGELVGAAQEWRRRNGKEASQYAFVDNRTGRSGHHGILSHSAHIHHSHSTQDNGSQSQYTLPRYSDHSGLTPRRLKRRSFTNSFSFSFDTE